MWTDEGASKTWTPILLTNSGDGDGSDSIVNRGRIVTSLLLSCHIFPPERTARRSGGGPTSASCARHFSYYRNRVQSVMCTVPTCVSVGKTTIVVVIGKRSISVVCKCSTDKCRIDKEKYCVIYQKYDNNAKTTSSGISMFRLKKKNCGIVNVQNC